MERYVAFIEIIGLPVLVERPGDRLQRILRELEDPLATLGDARIGEIPARFLVNSYRATTFAEGIALSTDANQLGLALLLLGGHLRSDEPDVEHEFRVREGDGDQFLQPVFVELEREACDAILVLREA